jgi:protein-tyrosine phosphatase
VWKLHTPVNREEGMWLVGYLNTNTNLMLSMKLGKILQHGNGVYRIRFSVSKMDTLPIPDFDYYKQNHFERFERYMKWIESRMINKEEFLNGIDEQFALLIGEEDVDREQENN